MVSHTIFIPKIINIRLRYGKWPDSKVHRANMGPTWVLLAPDGPHVGPMNLAIRETLFEQFRKEITLTAHAPLIHPSKASKSLPLLKMVFHNEDVSEYGWIPHSWSIIPRNTDGGSPVIYLYIFLPYYWNVCQCIYSLPDSS